MGVPGRGHRATDRLRDSLLHDTAVVPPLWWIEVGNVLLAATRRGRITPQDWKRGAADLAAFPIVVDQVSADPVLDAGVPPVTLDGRLSQACQITGTLLPL